VALVQAPPHPLDRPLEMFAADLAGVLRRFPQTRLVVHPELHLHGSPEGRAGSGADDHAELAASAEPLDGERVRTLATIAGDLGVWLVPGTVVERGPQGQLFNTAVVISPQGRLVASYRKIFPWRPYERFDPGSAFVVFDLPDVGRLGLSICYDAWFPEVARHLAWMGAEAILNLVLTTTVDRAQEVVLARSTAIVNQVFVASVNCAGPVGLGRSLIVDPEGLVRVEAVSEMPVVLTDVLDLDHVTRVREYGTAGLNRPWQQFRSGDAPIDLPLYDGRIDPATWTPPSWTPTTRNPASPTPPGRTPPRSAR
jgi:predicted amidohydrolase